MTDCLIGNPLPRFSSRCSTPVAKFADVPPPLPHGKPLIAGEALESLRVDLEADQLKKLRVLLTALRDNPFYSAKLQDAGADLDLTSLDRHSQPAVHAQARAD